MAAFFAFFVQRITLCCGVLDLSPSAVCKASCNGGRYGAAGPVEGVAKDRLTKCAASAFCKAA